MSWNSAAPATTSLRKPTHRPEEGPTSCVPLPAWPGIPWPWQGHLCSIMEVVYIKACPEHHPPGVHAIQSGPGGTEEEYDLMADSIMCSKCWDSDEAGMLRLVRSINLSEADVLMIREHVGHR